MKHKGDRERQLRLAVSDIERAIRRIHYIEGSYSLSRQPSRTERFERNQDLLIRVAEDLGSFIEDNIEWRRWT